MSKLRSHHKQDPNMLGDWLNVQLEALEPYRTTLAVVAGGVLVLALLSMFVFTGENPAAAQDWSLYLSAFAQQDPKNSLETLATNSKNTNSPAIWYAKLALADHLAARGAQLTFLNRTEAKETLDKAVKFYKEVESLAGSQPELQNRARLGLAGAYESLILPDDAAKTLELVKKNAGPDSVLGKTADESLTRLKNPRTLETLTWFASQEPAPPKTDPHSGLNFGEGVPDRPNFPGVKNIGAAPELPGTDAPPAETPDAPATETPATDKPEEKTPAETKPEDKPAEKPAETPPAATPPADPAKPAESK